LFRFANGLNPQFQPRVPKPRFRLLAASIDQIPPAPPPESRSDPAPPLHPAGARRRPGSATVAPRVAAYLLRLTPPRQSVQAPADLGELAQLGEADEESRNGAGCIVAVTKDVN